eukprot:TRINITY_DN5113_c0_g2_i1.p1 TRINITY_DN5113_c0_g2~~TRINITY_DN5113_c0_g2_i1.p1  ORF type:complete len:283 (-),score=43.32 TRINITY_DN5113_c0_g2_i1:68-916(-)
MANKTKIEHLKPKISTNLKGDPLSGPRGIIQDQESELIYIADAANHDIRVFSPNLVPIFKFGSSKTLATPAGMCIVKDIIYVCNWGSNTISIFTLEGEEITQMKDLVTSSGIQKLKQPIGVTYNQSQDEIFVCDYGGDLVKRFNDIQHVFAKVIKPFDIKLTQEFVIIVTGENTCLRFYSREGTLIKCIVSSNQGSSSLIGNPSFFGVDIRNTIWLSDYKRHCICQINMNGELLRMIGGDKSKQKNLFYNPTGLLLDKKGFLISACVRNTNQIQKFDITGLR